MKKKTLARIGATVAASAVIAGAAVMPAFAIDRVSDGHCYDQPYLRMHSGQMTCWANGGRVDVHLYGVYRVESPNDDGSWREFDGNVYYFKPGWDQWLGRQAHVIAINIGNV